MKEIRTSIIALLVGMSLLWWWADAAAIGSAATFINWRNLFVQYSGVLGISVMSVAMLLALRPGWIEVRLHGLDKMYRLHRWLGIAGVALSLFHWGATQAPKWAAALGLITREARGPRGAQGEAANVLLGWIHTMRDPAEEAGAWAMYAVVVFVAAALIKSFPYRYFIRTHRWIAVAYLALVFHGVVLATPSYWLTPLGAVLGLLLVCGTAAAVVSLLRRIGARRRVGAVVEHVEHHDGVHVTAVTVKVTETWKGHEAGQFAFVTFHQKEGAHPFTISSAWRGDGRLTFLVKALGDYTSTLSTSLATGDIAMVEGPYGAFDFAGKSAHQIWIGGGIGIAPFVARMQALSARPDGRVVDLIHTTDQVDEGALALLRADAAAAGVRLHVMITARDGLLTGERLRALLPDWMQADVWFCGPSAFGDAIRRDMYSHGLSTKRYHQELFAMR